MIVRGCCVRVVQEVIEMPVSDRDDLAGVDELRECEQSDGLE